MLTVPALWLLPIFCIFHTKEEFTFVASEANSSCVNRIDDMTESLKRFTDQMKNGVVNAGFCFLLRANSNCFIVLYIVKVSNT